MKYDFKAVEAKWQKVWQDEHTSPFPPNNAPV